MNNIKRKCQECGRVFDMFDEIDIEEWNYGHDCESEDYEQGWLVRDAGVEDER